MAARHGGNLRKLALRAGRDRDQILDFSASVNPLGPPDGLRAAVARALDRVTEYPDPEAVGLVRALAARHKLTEEQIVVGNGSSEILFAVARACRYRRAVIPVPTYSDYAAAVQAAGRETRFLNLAGCAGTRCDWDLGVGVAGAESSKPQQDGGPVGDSAGASKTQPQPPVPPTVTSSGGLKLPTGFRLNWQELASELREHDLVFLGQPNNPTGLLVDSDRLLALARQLPSVTFVVDEAFADFVEGYRSLIGRTTENVIIVRSLTKFYAIPGLRLGFAAGHAGMVAKIKAQIPPWSVNTLAQELGPAFLADEEYARQTVDLVCRERQRLVSELSGLPGLYVYPGEANYLLVRVDRAGATATELAERLLSDGIAIRTFAADEHLDERFFRVAVRRAEENERLVSALGACLNGGRPSSPRKPTPALMIQGTSSNAGKSVLVAALCRIMLQDGVRVAPFKSQNMSLNSFVTRDGGEMGRAQVVQAQACRLDPDVRMNPILLKPNSDTGCQVIVRGRPVGNMRVGEYVCYKPQAFAVAKECYDSLAAEFDAVVLEGAGSPGEVNLKSHDIVNMRMAEHARAPVLIVGDIDRGGVFASFVGTLEVLAPWERRLVAGWIVNRFRGDPSLLDDALTYTLAHTGRPVWGVVPYLPDLNLPQEDSVAFKSGDLDGHGARDGRAVEVAVIDLPHISNFTDLDPFRVESDVRLRIIRSAAELNQPDAVLLPGSKNTLADLEYLRRSGLAERIARLADRSATEIVGLCGGLQMLGRRICDPQGIESAAQRSEGLGLLGVETVLAPEKTLVRTSARHAPSGLEVTGYEIHHGRTAAELARPVLTRPDGEVVGVAATDERIWGTYLHGIFDSDLFRRWFVDRLRIRRGWPPLGKVIGCYDIEPALDRLADVVRQSVRMKDIYQLMKL